MPGVVGANSPPAELSPSGAALAPWRECTALPVGAKTVRNPVAGRPKLRNLADHRPRAGRSAGPPLARRTGRARLGAGKIFRCPCAGRGGAGSVVRSVFNKLSPFATIPGGWLGPNQQDEDQFSWRVGGVCSRHLASSWNTWWSMPNRWMCCPPPTRSCAARTGR